MTDFAFTGKKGTGKSKNAVRLARDRYFKKGRKVVSNLDIYLSPMLGPRSRATYVRVPDKPTAFDLLAAGHGNPDSYDEDKNGALILDEMGTWFNTRTFGDKGRADTLDYLAHARKHGFDCYYLMQSIVQVDKQLRESFVEQTVRHVRFDKVKWPFIGGLLGLLFGERAAYMPRFHLAVARIGFNPQDLVADRMTFTGKDIEPCYDTRQVFMVDYPHGTHSVLSPWHIEGRFLPPLKVPWWSAFFLGFRRSSHVAGPRPVCKPLNPIDPRLARVVSLCRSLPPSQAIPILNRYMGALSRFPTGCASAQEGGA